MIPDSIKNELARLNNKVDEAIKAHTEFLDKHMHMTAAVPIGEDIYNVETGVRLGKVKEHYRFHTKNNPLYDTNLETHCTFLAPGGIIDNTSRDYKNYGTKEQASAYLKHKAERLAE